MIAFGRRRWDSFISQKRLGDLGELDGGGWFVVGIAIVADIYSLDHGRICGEAMGGVESGQWRVSSDVRSCRVSDGGHDSLDGAFQAMLVGVGMVTVMVFYSRPCKMLLPRQ